MLFDVVAVDESTFLCYKSVTTVASLASAPAPQSCAKASDGSACDC